MYLHCFYYLPVHAPGKNKQEYIVLLAWRICGSSRPWHPSTTQEALIAIYKASLLPCSRRVLFYFAIIGCWRFVPLYLSDCITTALQCMTGRSCGHRQHHQDFDELSFLQRTQVLQQQQTTYIERKYYTGSLRNVVSCKVIELCRAEPLHFFFRHNWHPFFHIYFFSFTTATKANRNAAKFLFWSLARAVYKRLLFLNFNRTDILSVLFSRWKIVIPTKCIQGYF